ncbi:hypothetical protein FRC03_012931 [Tulasnella sp. 419]|nr:hypothetical protein FRC03_012931 [Tulasnella sp. 419]
MADLYYPQRHRPSVEEQPQYPPLNQSHAYGIPHPVHPSSSGSSLELDPQDDHEKHQQQPQQQHSDPPKLESKPQATFLTKLYALLERPEYQQMIRWDANGEQIIVERPEQLALHVLPSIYRQSRFASFSRQLNIYGFMRKVNLRNVDPAIDDPDASTWSHPTLNRHSPPEVVANFKRRVPPRLPKVRKPATQNADLPRPDISSGVPHGMHHHPASAGGINLPVVPSSIGAAADSMGPKNGMNNAVRPRAGTFPSLYSTMSHPMASVPSLPSPASATFPNGKSWGPHQQQQQQALYSRNALPPLSMPSDNFSSSYSAHSSHSSMIHPLTPTDDAQGSYGGYQHQQQVANPNGLFAYSYNAGESSPSSAHSNPSQGWAYMNTGGLPPASSLISSNGPPSGPNSLSSILNPSSSSNQRPPLSASNSFPSPFSSIPSHHTASPMSPDSRPNTGYSVGSSMAYDLQDPADNSSRPLTPISLSNRPSSSKSNGPSGLGAPSSGPGSLSIRNARPRRRSDAVSSPYPSPYYDTNPNGSAQDLLRPVTAPEKTGPGIQLPSVVSVVDPYHHGGQYTTSDFAYSPSLQSHHPAPVGSADDWANGGRLRPSTSTSSISASSASMIHTPPIIEDVEDHRAEGTPSSGGTNGMESDMTRYFKNSAPQQLMGSQQDSGLLSPFVGIGMPTKFEELDAESVHGGAPTSSSESLSVSPVGSGGVTVVSPLDLEFK